MRTFLFTMATTVALISLGPASAIARSHHRSSARHRTHVRHVQVRRFGDVSASAPSSSSSSSTTPASGDTAGLVTAFTAPANGMNGSLTIKLNDGSSVTGAVTDATELQCEAAQPSGSFQSDERGRSSDHGPSGGGDNSSSGDQGDNQAGDQSDANQGNDQNDANEVNGQNEAGDQGDNEATQACSSSPAMNTVVREAELRVSSAGAVWDKVDFVG